MIDRFRIQNDYEYIREKYKNYLILDRDYIKVSIEEWKNRILFTGENVITVPEHFDIPTIKKFKGIITTNRKINEYFLENGIKSYFVEYPRFDDDFYKLNNFVSFENKIKGVACLNKIYNPVGIGYGDIIYLRPEVMNNLSSKFIKHVYGPFAWGDPNKNVIFQNIKTNAYENKSLEIRNKYMFNLVMETIYNGFWGWDWLTERLFSCFKSKTIPLYLGAFNIEEYCPTEFIIDLRKYIISETPKIQFNYEKLNEDLNELMNNKDKYENIVNNAYEWKQKSTFGNFDTFINKLNTILGCENE